MRISVLGLGKMGAPMARNLIQVGHDVTLYSRNRQRALEVAGGTARAAATVAEAVKDAQVALTMVPDDQAERELTFGGEGLLAHLPKGAIHLCMSTIGLETSRELALAHAEAGQGYVAAPVFGRPGTAVSRHLWLVVGGAEAHVTRCLAIFEALGRGTTRVGPRAELAHALKLGGDALAATMVEGLAEVLAYGEKAGMPASEYLRLLNTAIFKSPMLDVAGGLMVRHMHEPADLTLDGSLSVLHAAMRASEELDAVMPMAELVSQRLELASAQGWGSQDLTALSRTCRMAAGLDDGEAGAGTDDRDSGMRESTFAAESPEGQLRLELEKVTHFELIKDSVWAWTQGNRYRTTWRHLAEVEKAFGHAHFLRIHRHILLYPEAARAHRSGAGTARKEGAEELLETALLHPAEAPVSTAGGRSVAGGDREQMARRPAEALRTAGSDWLRERWKALVSNSSEASADAIPEPGLRPVEPIRPAEPVHPAQPAPGRSAERQPEAKQGPTARVPTLLPVHDSEAGAQSPIIAGASHFEVAEGRVWAWIRGTRVRTEWLSLGEVETAFHHVALVRLQRNLLLHPEAVVSIKSAFGGRSKVTVSGDIVLEASRSATQRLKEVLGV